jgi:hypothetical protein
MFFVLGVSTAFAGNVAVTNTNPNAVIGENVPDFTITTNVQIAADVPYLVTATQTYTDVAPDTWYFGFVESLNAVGAFGITSGAWHPEEPFRMKAFRYWMRHLVL